MSSKTLRLNVPQRQGGTEPAYRFGAELLRWLAAGFISTTTGARIRRWV